MNLKLIICTLFVMTSLLSTSQSCIPVAIVFSTQAQVNAFPANYSGCTIITGNLGITGNDINNIDSLSQITTINGSVQILHASQITNLDGFTNLTSIGGSLSLQSRVHSENTNYLTISRFYPLSLKGNV